MRKIYFAWIAVYFGMLGSATAQCPDQMNIISSGIVTFIYNNTNSCASVPQPATVTINSASFGLDFCFVISGNVEICYAKNAGPNPSLPATVSYNGETCNYDNAGSILPINLIRFDAVLKGAAIELYWTTASEQNNDYMTIERSSDGKRFEAMGSITGAGTTLESQHYQFVDEQPFVGTNYYRIKQVDFDGSVHLHPIIAIDFDRTDATYTVFPNPVQEFVTLTLNRTAQEALSVKLYDSSGKLLKQISYAAPNQKLRVAVDELGAGVYYMELSEGIKRLSTKRIIKL